MILFQTQLEKEWFLSQIRSQLPIQERAFAINAILMNFQLKRGTFDIFQSREILNHLFLCDQIKIKMLPTMCKYEYNILNLEKFYLGHIFYYVQNFTLVHKLG